MSVVSLGLIVWVIIGSAIFLPLSVLVGRVASLNAAGFVLLFWFLITIAPLIWRGLKWRGMFYTLTDQRILSGHGVGGKNVDAVSIRRSTGYMDVQTARVTEVEMTIPLSGRIFGYGNIHFMSSTVPIDPWNGVKRPTEVRRFVEETMIRNQEVAGQQLAYGDAVTRTVAQITAQQRMGFLPQQAPYQASIPPATSSTAVPNVPATTSLPTPQAQASPTGFCVNCGTRLTAGAKFCPECGTAISQPKDKQPEQIPA